MFVKRWLCMDKKHFVGCRIDEQLFNKIKTHEEQSSTLVRKALCQYFRSAEPNHSLNGYNRELVDVLNNQIDDLKNDKRLLNEQIQALMLSSIPLLSRIKMKLLH